MGGGPGRPPRPAYPAPLVNLRQLAIAYADTVVPVCPAHRDIPHGRDGSLPDC